ncbi:MAG: histidine kinase [Clostridiaceae bacterium BRH_c20a]|nr:MAG: histidine kinase [Clostridiaceae bacterium BRH_c20a]
MKGVKPVRIGSRLSIQTQIIILASGLVFLSILFGGIFLVENFSAQLEKELGSKALAIARTLSQLEEIQQAVSQFDGSKSIQPIAEKTRLATNVEYIVVLNMSKTRLSHPLQNYIGTQFSGGDEAPAFAENEYISKAEGILGPSVRAFVPIMAEEGTKQVGVVVVGILTPTISKLAHNMRFELYFSLLVGLVVGVIGSVFFARNMKRVMFNMEPAEIARLLEERIGVFQSIGEGIIAIDRDNKITIMNDAAKRIAGIYGDVYGNDISDVIPNTRLPSIAQTGESEYQQETEINGIVVFVNRIPIQVKGTIVGAVAIFQDKTEVREMAEELTGVKKFIEALRVQNHEHLNKLHTIAGLIQLKKYEKALDYIYSITEEQQEVTRLITKCIKDYGLAGLILGKFSHAKELKISLEIDPKSKLSKLPHTLDTGAMVVVLGNLLENAMEAVSGLEENRRHVYFSIREDEKGLKIVVEDQGRGIAPDVRGHVFTNGFSTKGYGRGYGLYLVEQYVRTAMGTIEIDSKPNMGTRLSLFLPW